MKKSLKWLAAVALGTLIGGFGIIWMVAGWSGVVVVIAVLLGAKVG